jgi:hypothetical protein
MARHRIHPIAFSRSPRNTCPARGARLSALLCHSTETTNLSHVCITSLKVSVECFDYRCIRPSLAYPSSLQAV